MSAPRNLAPCAAFLLLCLAWSATAFAQPLREVVVVPFGTPDAAEAASAAAAVEAELLEAHVSLISLHDARDRFTARSRSPQQPTEPDLEALARAAHDAIEHVAFGRTAAAQKSVREVIARADRALESLNRETAVARQILDACLSLVRSMIQTDRRELALEQATRCRRLVPDLAPSRAAHPAAVIGVLSEADDLLTRMRIGRLNVESAPEPRCAVYLNGRHLGATPFELDRAAAGEYRVQVECGHTPARVHVVQLGDEPVKLLVDTEFDRAIASDPRLSLRYDDRAEARSRAVSHAARLGREVGADDVVLIALAHGRAELSRVQVRQQRLVGYASLPWSEPRGSGQTASLRQAIVALAEARIEGEPSLTLERAAAPTKMSSHKATRAEQAADRNSPLTSTPKDPQGTGSAEPSVRSDVTRPAPVPTGEHDVRDARLRNVPPVRDGNDRPAGRRWRSAVGVTALGFGAAAFAASAVFMVKRNDAGEKLPALSTNSGAGYTARVADWEDTRMPPYAFAALGSATLTSGALGVLLGSRRATFPTWASLLSGAAGAGLASWGIFDVARGGSCGTERVDRRKCADELAQRDRGALLLLAAGPLLVVPVTLLLRDAFATTERRRAVLYPGLNPLQKAVSVHARISWN